MAKTQVDHILRLAGFRWLAHGPRLGYFWAWPSDQIDVGLKTVVLRRTFV